MDRSRTSESYHRPYVTLIAAMTVDGKIATRSGDSEISSHGDLKELHISRSRVDAVMIGIGTQLKDDPLLTVRHVGGRNPIRVVVDSLARTPLRSRVLTTTSSRTIVAVSRRASKKKVRRLKQAGATVLRCGTRQVNLNLLLSKLSEMGLRRVLLEGGGNLNWSMLNAGLVDELKITVAPFIVGGEEATTLVEGHGVKTMNQAVRLQLTNAARRRNEFVLKYKVKS